MFSKMIAKQKNVQIGFFDTLRKLSLIKDYKVDYDPFVS